MKCIFFLKVSLLFDYMFTLFLSRFSDPIQGIDLGNGEGQKIRGSTGSNRGSTGGIDPVYIQNKK